MLVKIRGDVVEVGTATPCICLTHRMNLWKQGHTMGICRAVKLRRLSVRGVGETGFSRHTLDLLIFYNFHTNGTEKIMVLVADVILGLCKKIYWRRYFNNETIKKDLFLTSAPVPTCPIYGVGWHISWGRLAYSRVWFIISVTNILGQHKWR
jgi:hypothetical protein